MNGQEVMEDIREMERKVEMVREKFPEVPWPNAVMEPVFTGRLEKKLIPGRKAVLDSNSGEVFSVVSDNYTLVPNEVVVYHICEALGWDQEYDYNFRFPNNGGKFLGTVVLKDKNMEVGKEDFVSPSIVFKNSYDSVWKYELLYGAIRWVCANGMIAGTVQERIKQKHRRDVLTTENVQQHVQTYLDIYADQVNRWKKEQAMKLSKELLDGITKKAAFTEAQWRKIVHLPIIGQEGTLEARVQQNDATVWDLRSAMTQFITHEVKSDIARVDLGVRTDQIITYAFAA